VSVELEVGKEREKKRKRRGEKEKKRGGKEGKRGTYGCSLGGRKGSSKENQTHKEKDKEIGFVLHAYEISTKKRITTANK
jgi:hypothetical protein